MSRDELLSHFYETPSIWGGKQNTPCSNFAKGPRFFNMVMTFTFTPLSHYNSITEPRARFLLSLLEDLFINFLFHSITSILDVYQDIATCDKLIFPSAITHILRHFSIPIPDFPYSPPWVPSASVLFSEVRPSFNRSGHMWRQMIPPLSSSFSTFTPSSTTGVNLEAIMAQLQRMEADFSGRLDYLINEMCKIKTRVGCIACRQARLGGFPASLSPSLEASVDKDDDVFDDDEDDASFSNDGEMTDSQ